MTISNLDLSATHSVDHKKGLVRRMGIVSIIGSLILGTVALSGVSSASAATSDPPIGLGTAGSYSVLGGATVTNTGATVLGQDLGVSPGTAITGFPPGIVLGATHATDAAAAQAQLDLTTAYNDAASRATSASVSGDLVGQTLPGGVYTSAGPLALSGTLTLDGQNDPNSVFVFQAGSTLTTASASSIELINGAQPCNVFWQVGSSATLGTNSTFVGTIMALTSISVETGATVEGRALARNGQVSLDTNVFTLPGCSIPAPNPSATPSTPAVTPSTPAAVPSAPATTPSAPAVTPSTPAVVPSTPVTPSTPNPTMVVGIDTYNGTTGGGGGINDNGDTGNTDTDTDTNMGETNTGGLAETGVSDTTPLFAGAGLFLLFAGIGLLVSNRFRKVRQH
jgi:LPXTG-motif cell wall-anchored protein